MTNTMFEPEEIIETDVLVIGSGMGGGIIARTLAEKGREVVVLERGERLPREAENWDVGQVFINSRYKNAEKWLDSRGREFLPGVHYYVGGNTKVYGASLPRFREKDFTEYETEDGISPAWPFSYKEIEKYYLQAEHMLEVRGTAGSDPTEPWRSGDYLFPALRHEKPVKALEHKFLKQGLHPYGMPMGVDSGPLGTCILCKTCDGFPCKIGAKRDAETCGIDRAIESGAKLHTGVTVDRLIHDKTGKQVVGAVGTKSGKKILVRANKYVLSAGAANSAAVLLRSTSELYPNGLSNSTGLVGRNWMVHNATFMIAFNPLKTNPVSFQKTLGVNDWYLADNSKDQLGNIQMLGKIQGEMIKGVMPFLPRILTDYITNRSMDLYLESEDTPKPENRITLNSEGRLVVHWKPSNLRAHKRLVQKATLMMIRAGYPVVLTRRMGIETNSHMCGTVVAGNDPTKSVLDGYCRSHELENLYVVDASFFPSSAAMNPALTIAAQALRVADEGGL